MYVKAARQGLCAQCGRSSTAKFAVEACVHAPGLENINFPGVFVFPKLTICWECGSASGFQIPNEELADLRKHVRSTTDPKNALNSS